MAGVVDRPDGMMRFTGETIAVSHKGRVVEVHELLHEIQRGAE